MTIGSRHLPLRTLVCDELRRLIITGALAPGTRLVEDRLAERLSVSRNPVREALQVLASEGFVTITPRRGAVVGQITGEQAEELFDVRMALESLAARTAARKARPEHVLRLQDVLDRAAEATRTGELDLLTALNTEFHDEVVHAGGNDYLALLVAPMAQRVQWVFRASAPQRAVSSWNEHEAVLRAIALGDEESAAVLASAHVASARTTYRQLIADPRRVPGQAGEHLVTRS